MSSAARARSAPAVGLEMDGDRESAARRGLPHERQALVLRRSEPPPRDDDGVDPRGSDLAHLRVDDLGVGRRVEAAARKVRRREDWRTVAIDVPVRPPAVPHGGRVPRVVEDRDAPAGRLHDVLTGRCRERDDGRRDRDHEDAREATAAHAGGTLTPAPDRHRYDLVGGRLPVPDRRRRHDRRRRGARDP